MKLSLPNLCVFHRELSGLARQRKLLFARLLMLVPGAWVLLVIFMDGSEDLTIQGRDGFKLIIRLEVAAIAIVIPALTATIIAEELERNTLQLLLLTQQAPGRVLLQKLMSRILATLVLLLLPLPLLITFTSTGGVSYEMLIFGLLTMLLAFEICLLGSLMASWFTRTVIAAYLMSYVAIATMGFFLYLFMEPIIMEQIVWGGWNGWINWGVIQSMLVKIATVIGLVVLPIACLITLRRMATVAMRPTRPPLWVSLYNRYSRALRRLRKWGQPLVEELSLDSQPMLWREYHLRFYATNSFILRFLALMTIVIMALIFLWDAYVVDRNDVRIARLFDSLYYSSYHINYMMGGLILPPFFYLPALIPLLLGISAITREESCHSLDSLRVTPLSDDAIFGAKLWMVVKVSIPVPAILLVVTELRSYLNVFQNYNSIEAVLSYGAQFELEPYEIFTKAILIASLILLIAGTAMYSAMQRRRFLPALFQAIAWLGLLAGACAILWMYLVVLYEGAGYHVFNGFFVMLGAFGVWKLARKLQTMHGVDYVIVICFLSGGAGIWLFASLLTKPRRYYGGPDFDPSLVAWALAHLMLWLAWRRASSWLRPA